MYDLPENAGQMAARVAMGHRFTLWLNAVATSRTIRARFEAERAAGQHGPKHALSEEVAAQVQSASRNAAAAAGLNKAEIEGREFLDLYPECKNPEVAAVSRKALVVYIQTCPDKMAMNRWRQRLAMLELHDPTGGKSDATKDGPPRRARAPHAARVGKPAPGPAEKSDGKAVGAKSPSQTSARRAKENA